MADREQSTRGIPREASRSAVQKPQRPAEGPKKVTKAGELGALRIRLEHLVATLRAVRTECQDLFKPLSGVGFNLSNVKQHLTSTIEEIVRCTPHWICPQCQDEPGDVTDPCPKCGGCGWLSKVGAAQSEVLPAAEAIDALTEIAAEVEEQEIDPPEPPGIDPTEPTPEDDGIDPSEPTPF